MAGTSRINREVYVRFCGRLVVKFLRPTRQALMNRDLRQEAAPAKLSMLLDQLETALPVLVGAPSLRPADWSELDRRLNGVRSLLANATYRSRTRRARSPTVRPARSDGMPIATLF